MATFNHKIEVVNGNATDTFHPQTNTGQVYDYNNATWLSSIIGTLSSLTTTQKSSLVASLNEIAGNVSTHLNDYMPHDSGLSQYSSSVDTNGVYRVVEYKRADNTLYLKSTASNPNAAGRYQTITWQFYAANGTTLALTKTWTITYDANGVIVSKVVT